MKKLLLAALLITLTLCFSETKAQDDNNNNYGLDNSFTSLSTSDTLSLIKSAFGYARIGEKNYVGMRIQPELNFGKIGIGLDVPIYFNIDGGDFYSDEFKNEAGILRLISYLRYGRKKRDPIYFKIGQLRGESVGYGNLVNNYNNSSSFEKRKLGLSYDIRIGDVVGVEGMYSDFNLNSYNLMAVRPYVRPFGKSNIPVVKTLDIGFSYVSDHDKTERYDESREINSFLSDGINAWSVDMGIQIINTSFINLSAYTHYTEIQKVKSDSLNAFINKNPSSVGYGKGVGYGAGLNANMNIIGNFFKLNTRIERLWYSDNYIPQLFDAIYEVNKDAKIQQLAYTPKKHGIYGSITASLFDKILVGGNLLLPDNISEENPASLQLNLKTKDLFDKIVIEGSYIKGNLTNLNDAFSLDDSSLAVGRFAYKVAPFILTGIDYRWSWTLQEAGNYKASSSVMPYVAISIPLGGM